MTCHSSTEICAKNGLKKSNWEIQTGGNTILATCCWYLIIFWRQQITSYDVSLLVVSGSSLGRKCCHNVICSKRVTQVIVLSSICSQILIMFFPLHRLLKKPSTHTKCNSSGLEIGPGVSKIDQMKLPKVELLWAWVFP